MKASDARQLRPGDWVQTNWKYPARVVSLDDWPKIHLEVMPARGPGPVKFTRRYQSIWRRAPAYRHQQSAMFKGGDNPEWLDWPHENERAAAWKPNRATQ